MLIKFKLQDEEESLRKCFKIDEERQGRTIEEFLKKDEENLLRNCVRKMNC
jgi:hypothetical protein